MADVKKMMKSYSFFVTPEDEYKSDPQLKREDVKILQEWVAKEPHLPEISEMKLLRFLHSNYYKIEATKQCIENYYTIRANCDDIFSHHDVFSKPVKDACQFVMCSLVVSKPEYKVIMAMIYDPNTDLMKTPGSLYCLLDILNQLFYAQYGRSDDHIMIIDGSTARLAHALKLPLIASKILMMYVQKAVPIRLKAVHVVNISPGLEKLYSFFRPFLGGELIEKVHMHRNIEDLHKHLPKDSIPKDLGGDAPCYQDMYDEQINWLEANAEWIRELGKEKADESKRQKKINFGEMLGYEGTFKKLEID